MEGGEHHDRRMGSRFADQQDGTEETEEGAESGMSHHSFAIGCRTSRHRDDYASCHSNAYQTEVVPVWKVLLFLFIRKTRLTRLSDKPIQLHKKFTLHFLK